MSSSKVGLLDAFRDAMLSAEEEVIRNLVELPNGLEHLDQIKKLCHCEESSECPTHSLFVLRGDYSAKMIYGASMLGEKQINIDVMLRQCMLSLGTKIGHYYENYDFSNDDNGGIRELICGENPSLLRKIENILREEYPLMASYSLIENRTSTFIRYELSDSNVHLKINFHLIPDHESPLTAEIKYLRGFSIPTTLNEMFICPHTGKIHRMIAERELLDSDHPKTIRPAFNLHDKLLEQIDLDPFFELSRLSSAFDIPLVRFLVKILRENSKEAFKNSFENKKYFASKFNKKLNNSHWEYFLSTLLTLKPFFTEESIKLPEEEVSKLYFDRAKEWICGRIIKLGSCVPLLATFAFVVAGLGPDCLNEENRNILIENLSLYVVANQLDVIQDAIEENIEILSPNDSFDSESIQEQHKLLMHISVKKLYTVMFKENDQLQLMWQDEVPTDLDCCGEELIPLKLNHTLQTMADTDLDNIMCSNSFSINFENPDLSFSQVTFQGHAPMHDINLGHSFGNQIKFTNTNQFTQEVSNFIIKTPSYSFEEESLN